MLTRKQVERSLRRLLSHGLLDALPKREEDRRMLYALGAWRIHEAGADQEPAINTELEQWLGKFCFAVNVDHVTFRREMVDAGFIGRSDDGSRYWINDQQVHRTVAADALDVDPGDVMVDETAAREERKRRYLQPSNRGGA